MGAAPALLRRRRRACLEALRSTHARFRPNFLGLEKAANQDLSVTVSSELPATREFLLGSKIALSVSARLSQRAPRRLSQELCALYELIFYEL